ncbi:hypothetical protein B0H16DRAFT_1616728 [Mycena metata]|uniref:Uncharacterized protein n=1 Tax=Mycena metata TaxID=1033252 RepID=A0AAD7MFG4_9AGAR|nr:hypothetical protein B0H16DRAFT_1616728 [Mycena metata]
MLVAGKVGQTWMWVVGCCGRLARALRLHASMAKGDGEIVIWIDGEGRAKKRHSTPRADHATSGLPMPLCACCSSAALASGKRVGGMVAFRVVARWAMRGSKVSFCKYIALEGRSMREAASSRNH